MASMNNIQNKIIPSDSALINNFKGAQASHEENAKENQRKVASENWKNSQPIDIESNEVDYEYLYSLVNKENEKDMLQEFNEQFNEKNEFSKVEKPNIIEKEVKPINKKPSRIYFI